MRSVLRWFGKPLSLDQAYDEAANARLALEALYWLTPVWLMLRLYTVSYSRFVPDLFVQPEPWLARLLYPGLLGNNTLWVTLISVGMLLWSAAMAKRNIWLFRALLAAVLLVLNIFEHRYGNMHHQNHHFVLAHVFFLFLPRGRRAQTDEEARLLAGIFRWVLAALLFTYMLAGVSKLGVLAKDVLTNDYHRSWLSPDANTLNAVTGFMMTDKPLIMGRFLEQFRWAGPPIYLGIVFMQVFVFIAAFKPSLRLYALAAILVFHLSTTLFFDTVFLFVCLVWVGLLFPFHRIRTAG